LRFHPMIQEIASCIKLPNAFSHVISQVSSLLVRQRWRPSSCLQPKLSLITC
jgi:hypothetical protein